MKVISPELEPLELSIPDSIKEMRHKLNKHCPDEYYVVDFLYCDIGNSEPTVVQPTKVIDLELLKDLVMHWFENKDITKKLANGKEVTLFPMVVA
ncbi:hypothetical protein HN385_08430 [archaeon]|jgi:hypothetical protein|nr:hypothetical protein [archaeon]MBT4207996.1 hypothetical protein [Candidatus Woesearchaeota archaeon]MBT4732288.1 hypothetical protein [Candidatus Woesearchaeota archaeon]MBT7557090.1 hypothetical protein [Candidatus Woesearchaeota archaeon]